MTYAAPAALLQAALLVAGCSPRDDSAPDGPRVSGNDSEAPPAPVATVPVSGPERTILALGDSLYAGYGLGRGQSLPDAIQARLRAGGINARLVNAGVSGDTTSDGRRRLGYTLDRLGKAPDLVLLGLGGNDVLRQLDPKVTRDNLAAMLDELEKRRIPVVLTGMLAPPNLGPDYAGRFNAIYPALAKQHHAPLYPFILDGVIGNRALMLLDGVHPNASGVARIADRLTPVVRQALTDMAGR
ncbi:arylesterase [Sphingomonas yunnanensis]|nr:arylesterase [Sphingomonas yunnanensis]